MRSIPACRWCTGARGVEYVKASDEHGVLARDGGAPAAIGERVWLIPGHCDPTVNLYDWIVAVRGGVVEARVAGRSARRARLNHGFGSEAR